VTQVEPDELAKVLGSRLRDLRIRRHLTQLELANRANVAVGALKHLEAGAGTTTITLVKVLRALGEEHWLNTLGPGPTPFNPLELLEARQQQHHTAARRTRVYHGKTAT